MKREAKAKLISIYVTMMTDLSCSLVKKFQYNFLASYYVRAVPDLP